MSVYRIFYNGKSKYATPVMSREEYLAIRNQQFVKDTLKRVREDGQQSFKMQLPQMNYNGHYPTGAVKGNRFISNAFTLDIDNPGEFQRVSQLLLANPGEWDLLMLERSANYGGHAVFRRKQGRTILENQCRVAKELNCELDTNAHDINRVLFTTSADPDDLLFLSDELFADAFDRAACEKESREIADREKDGREVLPVGAHNGNKHFCPWMMLKGGTPAAEPSPAAEPAPAPLSALTPQPSTVIPSYGGIAYSYIAKKWLDEFNGGQEPVEGSRNNTLYSMALDFRHICEYNPEVMMKALPNYGLSDEEKRTAIESACSRDRTKMRSAFHDLLDTFRNEGAKSEQLNELLEVDDNYVADHLQCVPQGFRDSIAATGSTLAMPALLTAASCVGALATGIRLDVHGDMKALNLIVFITGQAGSGKGLIGPVVKAWMQDIIAEDSVYLQQEEDFRTVKRAAKNKKEQPEEQKFPIRYLTFNNTLANIAERLNTTGGRHAFSFTSEADEVAAKWSSSLSDFSTLLRKAYDNDDFFREARSVDAVNVHIREVFWNSVMCGTPGALFRVVRNFEDGFQTRIALATTPDNTFAPLTRNQKHMTEECRSGIRQVARLLPLLEGEVVLPEIEETGYQWLEKVRLKALEDYDAVLARQRMRVCVTAQRVTCCMMLCSMLEKLIRVKGSVEKSADFLRLNPIAWHNMLLDEQTDAMKANFNLIADTMLDTNMYYFRKQIRYANDEAEENIGASPSRSRAIASQSVFDLLPREFTTAEAGVAYFKAKGRNVSAPAISQMITVWLKRGMVEKKEIGVYMKR